MDWMRDPAWQFAGVLVPIVLAGIGGLYTLLRLYRSKNQKRIQYEIIGAYSMLKLTGPLRDYKDAKILWNNAAFLGVHTYIVKFINTGRTPILPSDYSSPLFVELLSSKRMLKAEVIEARNPSLQRDINRNLSSIDAGSIAELPAVLLNPNDWLTVMFVSEEEELGELRIGGHIQGVQEVLPLSTKSKRTRLDILMFLIAVAGILTIPWALLPIRELTSIIANEASEFPVLGRFVDMVIWITFQGSSIFYLSIFIVVLVCLALFVRGKQAGARFGS